MERLPGRNLRECLFPACDEVLIKRYARRVVDLTRLPYQRSLWFRDHLPRWPMERTLAWHERRAQRHRGDPIMNYALSWLRERRPAPQPLVFSHGDVNPSNFLVAECRITGIVDWEFACLRDDPLGEVEFFCWLDDGALVERGFTSAFAEALGRDPDELHWFFALALFGITFSSDEPDPAAFRHHRERLAAHVGYSSGSTDAD
jgi:aminoglycoside phosphotransferase (APT) family kinase protein